MCAVSRSFARRRTRFGASWAASSISWSSVTACCRNPHRIIGSNATTVQHLIQTSEYVSESTSVLRDTSIKVASVAQRQSSTMGMTKIPKQNSHHCATRREHNDMHRCGFGHHCHCCEPNQENI